MHKCDYLNMRERESGVEVFNDIISFPSYNFLTIEDQVCFRLQQRKEEWVLWLPITIGHLALFVPLSSL